MDCPRCEGELERYTRGESEAVVCRRCGYADVPADHRSDGADPESWDDALQRFLSGE